MTKAQAARRINRVFKEYNRILEKTLNEILKDADMWYGDSSSATRYGPENRGVRLLVFEGPILGWPEAGRMLRTRKELGVPPKRNVPRGTSPGKAQQGNPEAKNAV